MATTSSPTLRRGTWLVVGLVLFATVLVIISRVYRTPPPEDAHGVLRQQGLSAARRGMELSLEGIRLLSVEEQQEWNALYTEALLHLSPEDQQHLRTLAQKGLAMSDRELTEINTLLQRALSALPQEKNARLWALSEKAVQLQLAQEQPSAATQQE